jgi:hypothetical protein
MSEFLNNPELQAFENELRKLLPAAAALKRDELLFRAGQASVRKQRRVWIVTSSCLLACLAGVSAVLAWHLMAAPERIRIVYVEKPAPSAQGKNQQAAAPAVSANRQRREQELPRAAYLQMREQVLRWGADGIPSEPRISTTKSGNAEGVFARHGEGAPGSWLKLFTPSVGEKE